MLQIPFFFTVIILLLTTFATPFNRPKPINFLPQRPRVILKQATRSQIVARANRPAGERQRRQAQASPLPFPRSSCTDYTSTGTTPYARWINLDYASADQAIYIEDVPSREACTKICELETRCTIATYNPTTQECFEVTRPGNYFNQNGAFQATTKGNTCEDLGDTSAAFPGSQCCTEYRA